MRIPQITEVQAHILQRFEAERLDHAGAFQETPRLMQKGLKFRSQNEE